MGAHSPGPGPSPLPRHRRVVDERRGADGDGEVRGTRQQLTAMTVDLETLFSLCKRRGFVFPSSEIYGGFGGFWDYGPLGVELKRNLKDAWWRANVQERDDVVGLDTSVIMAPRVWEASEHIQNFT